MHKKWIISFLLVFFLITACSSKTVPTPISTDIPADTNADGMFSKEEMKVTFSTMHDLADQLAASRPEIAAKVNAEVTEYEEILANDPFNLEMAKVQQTANELLAAIQEVNTELGY